MICNEWAIGKYVIVCSDKLTLGSHTNLIINKKPYVTQDPNRLEMPKGKCLSYPSPVTESFNCLGE